MRFLRAVGGYRLRKEEAKRNIFCLNIKIKEYQENWLQQLQRIEEGVIPYKILHYCPTGRRIPGHPTKRWKYQFDLNELEARSKNWLIGPNHEIDNAL